MKVTLTVSLLVALVSAQQNWDATDDTWGNDTMSWEGDEMESECYEDGWQSYKPCEDYTQNPDDKDCWIYYEFNNCSEHTCTIEQNNEKSDCMNYFEDYSFWQSIDDSDVFDDDYQKEQMHDYWTWYHEHGEGDHSWENDSGDWESDCWYEKHDLEFSVVYKGKNFQDWLSAQMFYDPCNEFSYPVCKFLGNDDGDMPYDYDDGNCWMFFEDSYLFMDQVDFKRQAIDQGATYISDYWYDVLSFNSKEVTPADLKMMRNQGFKCSRNLYKEGEAEFWGRISYCWNPKDHEQYYCQLEDMSESPSKLMRCNPFQEVRSQWIENVSLWYEFHEDNNSLDHFYYFEDVVHSCENFDKECYWELCESHDQNFGPETCWREFCGNGCGDEMCEEWHAYDQDDAGQYLWYQQPCPMSEEDMAWMYAEEGQDALEGVAANYDGTINYAMDKFDLQGMAMGAVNMTASTAAGWADDYDFNVAEFMMDCTYDQDCQDFLNQFLDEAEDSYDVDVGMARDVANGYVEPSEIVNEFSENSDDMSTEWIGNWMDAFTGARQEEHECDEYTIYEEEWPNLECEDFYYMCGHNPRFNWETDSALECRCNKNDYGDVECKYEHDLWACTSMLTTFALFDDGTVRIVNSDVFVKDDPECYGI